jgi:hypothetical protein
LTKFRGCTEAYSNGRKITIRQARRGRPKGTYLCPECRNPVFAANLSSTFHAPCFKHFEEPEQCNRYFGGEFGDAEAQDSFLSLRLVLEVDESQTQSWRLFLQLPAARFIQRGLVQAYTGPSLRLVEIPLSRLDDNSLDVAIAPCFEPYSLDWVRGDDAQEYLQSFERHKQSVALHNPVTAFEITHSGRSSRVDRQVYWSRSYYFVHHADLLIPAELRPEQASQKFDRRYHEWRCARVVLPYALNETLNHWLETNVGLPVKAAPVRATVLYPFTIGLYNAAQRTTAVAATTHALVAIEQPVLPSVELQCAVEQDAHVVALPLPAHSISFARISAPDSANLPLCFGADEDPSGSWYPLATLTPTAQTQPAAEVQFEFEQRKAVASHEPGVIALFSNVRRSRIALLTIRNPQDVAITIETRSFPGAQWHKQGFVSDDVGIALLNELLHNQDLDLRIVVAGMLTIALPATAPACETDIVDICKSDPLLAQYRRLFYASARRGDSRVFERALAFDDHPAALRTRALSGRGVRVR